MSDLEGRLIVNALKALEGTVVPKMGNNRVECVWRETGRDGEGLWEGECGMLRYFGTWGTPHDHQFNYCPKCGKRLIVKGAKE